jgi:hypothetical protein
LYSTKASEYAAVKGLLDQGLSMEDAVEVVAGMKINVVKSEVA